jgi:hypothetical protein
VEPRRGDEGLDWAAVLVGCDVRACQGNRAPLSLRHAALVTAKKDLLSWRPGRPRHNFNHAQSHMVIAHWAWWGDIQRRHIVCCHRAPPLTQTKPGLPRYRVQSGGGKPPFCRAQNRWFDRRTITVRTTLSLLARKTLQLTSPTIVAGVPLSRC